MRRGILALLPVLGLSGVFLANQSCATKSALEEVEKEADTPKENVAQARDNLSEARTLLGDAKRILEEAKGKLDAHIADRKAHTPPPPPEPVTEVVEEEKEPEPVTEAMEEEKEQPAYGEVKVGWCDTLWDISHRVYGNSLYWPSIYDLNRDKIGADPWILSQGQVLKYKVELSEEEKDEAVRKAIEWDLKFKERPRSPKCPPK